jgi:uncharacterized protein YbjT (DUF2867 family)
MSGLIKRGAEGCSVDIMDGEALAQACDGAEAVYALIPPNVGAQDVLQYQQQITESIASAIENAGVTHAVVLSSVGADKPDRTGPVVGVHRLEERLKEIEWLNAVFLRAAYFMENLLPQVHVIHDFGMMAGPLKPDLPIAMIAAKDIGAAAADRLIRLDFKGKETRELLGHGDLTYVEAAKIIGRTLGHRSLFYTELPKQQMMEALLAMGFSESMARALLEMAEALNQGYMKPLEQRSPQNTTPTSIEQWVEEVFVPTFKGRPDRPAGRTR